MQEYQKRVVDEQTVLEEKTNALYVFLGSKLFSELDTDEQELLTMQYRSMLEYSGILLKRIVKF